MTKVELTAIEAGGEAAKLSANAIVDRVKPRTKKDRRRLLENATQQLQEKMAKPGFTFQGLPVDLETQGHIKQAFEAKLKENLKLD